MRKNIISIMLMAALLLVPIGSSYAGASFSDVKSSNWAYTYISELVEKGSINGYKDGTFKPNNTITAAEFVKIVVALVDGDKDRTGLHWASGYMRAAEVLEIVPEGMFEKSDWDKAISRQKMGVIMEKTAENLYSEDAITDTAKLASVKAGIKDYSSICDYCKDYIIQAVSRGLINGYTDGTFKPTNTATRAEAATMIIRVVEPAYRVYTAVTAPDPGVVATGTNISDYVKTDYLIELIDSDTDKYVVLKDGSKFYLSYYGSTDENFYVNYKCYGKVYTLDKNGNTIDASSPTNSPIELVTQAFSGKLKDTAYFVFVDLREETAYIVPNTLTE